MHVSWLVLHGDVLRWVALVLFLVGGWTSPVLWLRWRAWWAVRERRRAFERAAGGRFEEGAVVTLKGQLELRGAACARFEDGSAAAIAGVFGQERAATVQGEHLYLRGEPSVVLKGPFEVLLGSRQTVRRRRLNQLDLATMQRVGLALAVEPEQALHFTSLAHRDPVWVKGRLLRHPIDKGGVAGWRLHPEAERIPLLYRGVPKVSAYGWWRPPAATMTAIVLYFGIAKLAYVTGFYALGSASPYRTLALQRLRDNYSVAAERDPRALEPLEVVQAARGDHCHLLSRLRELGHLERAARVSPRCSEPAEVDALALCLVRRGRFADASAVLSPTPKARGMLYPGVDLAVNVHLMANQPRRALARLEYLSQLEPVRGVSVEVANETKTRTECLKLSLRARLDHDSAALAALRKRSAGPLAQYVCTVLYADLVEGDDQHRALESCSACRTKRASLMLPWLLGVNAACPRGKEESSHCADWLLAVTRPPIAPTEREGADPPSVRKVSLERGTCYRPRGWYERELDPRRTLASLVWTAQSTDEGVQPELVEELRVTARAFTTALSQREVAVPLMALHY